MKNLGRRIERWGGGASRALFLALALLLAYPIAARETAPGDVPTYADRFAPGILLEPVPRGRPQRRVFQKGIEEIKHAEGLVAHLYNDAAGFCTIGYGHLIKRAPCDGSEPAEFRDGISEAEAETLLIRDVALAQIAVENAVTVDLTDGQYAALVSFTYNVGGTNLRRSTLLKVINSGEYERVPIEMRRWRMAGGQVFQGLINRREREIALFFDGEPLPAPPATAGGGYPGGGGNVMVSLDGNGEKATRSVRDVEGTRGQREDRQCMAEL